MTEPGEEEPTREQQAVTPSVSTAPARAGRRWSALPSHLGHARTSTLVLSALFLTIGALYLTVKPDPTGAATVGTNPGVEQPAGPTTPPTTTPPTSAATSGTTKAPTPTEQSPTTSEGLPTTERSSRTTPPGTSAPSTPSTPSSLVSPSRTTSSTTGSSPTG